MKLCLSGRNTLDGRQKENYTLKQREHHYEYDLTVFEIYRWDKILQQHVEAIEQVGSKQQKGVCALEKGKRFHLFFFFFFLKQIHLIMVFNPVLDLLV